MFPNRSATMTNRAFLLALLLPIAAFANSYSDDWHVVSGGGGTSSGGNYSNIGTIGQADAGTLTGGNYILYGGFWGFDADNLAAAFDYPPVANTDTYTHTPGSSLKISIADLLANDTDPRFESIALNSINLITTNNILLTTDATHIFYPAGTAANDQFTYSITNTDGACVYGIVRILVAQMLSFSPGIAQPGSSGPGTNSFTFSGTPDLPYTLQYATNLVDAPWITISTNVADDNGLWQAIDPSAGDNQRFYRISAP